MNTIKFLGALMNNKLNINEILKSKGIISNNDYTFIENNKELLDNLLFLCLGGSYSYGTNKTDGSSDIDIRGVKMNTQDDILLNKDSEQSINEATDTTIYTINKYLDLLYNVNPNVIEFLGSIERNALYIHPYFKKMVIDNKNLFLTKRAYNSFGGYALAQLNRLNNKCGRVQDEVEIQNLLRSIKKSKEHFYNRYGIKIDEDLSITSPNGKQLDLYIKDLNKEQLQSCLNEIATIIKDYNKVGKRNKHAIEHNKLTKHAMHLIRLENMGIDILKNGEINTYREKDHNLLMSIRNNENNKWFDEAEQPTEELNKLISDKEKELKEALDNSKLPSNPDMKKINELRKQINYDIITENWRNV